MGRAEFSSFNIKEVEDIIDLILLEVKEPNELLPISFDYTQFRYHRLIAESLLSSTILGTVPYDEGLLNSYVCSRLALTGFAPEFDLNYLYQLADAMRSFEVVDILRWYYVLKCFINRKTEIPFTTVVLFVKQVQSFLQALLSISDDSAFKRELSILHISYDLFDGQGPLR